MTRTVLSIGNGGRRTAINQQPMLPSQFVEFTTPSANAGPNGIAQGVDGKIYFTETNADKIGICDMQIRCQEVALSAGAHPLYIASGIPQDSHIWFTEPGINKIGRLNIYTGVVSEISVPTANAGLMGIAVGTNYMMNAGLYRVYFAEHDANKIGMLNINTLQITEVTLPTAGAGPEFIAQNFGCWAGSEDNMFTETGSGKVGFIDPGSKSVEERTIPLDGASSTPAPTGIAPMPCEPPGGPNYLRGPYLWLEPNDNRFGYWDGTSDNMGNISIKHFSARPFTAPLSDQISAISRTNYSNDAWFLDGYAGLEEVNGSLPNSPTYVGRYVPKSQDATSLTYASDGNVWITEKNASRIGVYVVTPMTATPSSLTLSVGQSASLDVSSPMCTGCENGGSANSSIAKLTGATSSTSHYTVQGVAAGSTKIVIIDTYGNRMSVPVTVN